MATLLHHELSEAELAVIRAADNAEEAAAYAAIDHNHDGTYTPVEHNHDLEYLALGSPPVLTGDGTVFDDLVFEMTQSRVGALAKPDFSSTENGLLFPQNDATEIVYINVQMPHAWKEGSTIYPHVHWHQTADQTPVFKLDYRWANIGGQVGDWTTGYVMSTKIGTPYTGPKMHQISHGAGIAGTGKTLSSILQLKLYRDDNAYTGDVLVSSFDIHYEIDAMGSGAEYTK